MADVAQGVQHGEYSTTTASSGATPPNHLGHSVPSGNFDGTHDHEKTGLHNGSHPVNEKAPVEDDEDDEDMDALIDDLESQDGHAEEAEEEETTEAGGARPVAEELLQTDTRIGLTETEVSSRRKKYGLNQMKEEKENLILKFLGYFIGPIQFVMEVSRCE